MTYQLYLSIGRGQWVAVGRPRETEAELVALIPRMRMPQGVFEVRWTREHIDDCLCPECLQRRRHDQLRLDVQ